VEHHRLTIPGRNPPVRNAQRSARQSRGPVVLVALAAWGVTACGTLRSAAATASTGPEIRAPQAHFLDQTSIAIAPKRPVPLIHETHAAANVVVVQTLERAGSQLRWDTTGASGASSWRWAHMGAITPAFVIRQLSDSSAAVSPPNFNPKGTWQLFRMRKAAPPGVSTNVNRWKHVDVQLVDLVFAHWSNGQAGCFYANQRFVRVGGEFECLWVENDSSNRTLNTGNGSFSTWYLRAGLGAERHWGFDAAQAASNRHFGALVSLQYHLPFMTEPPQRPLFGDWRLRVDGEYEEPAAGRCVRARTRCRRGDT
jgi:hypothetical protein